MRADDELIRSDLHGPSLRAWRSLVDKDIEMNKNLKETVELFVQVIDSDRRTELEASVENLGNYIEFKCVLKVPH